MKNPSPTKTETALPNGRERAGGASERAARQLSGPAGLEAALVRRAARVRMERAGVRLSVQDGLRVGRRWMALMDAAVRLTGQDFVSAMASGPVIFLGTADIEHGTSNVEGRERSAA